MIKHGFFITGTDTGVGKTCITACLANIFQEQGQRVALLKPVASGLDPQNMINEDVNLLASYTNVECDLNEINPICFKLPIAPSIAASLENKPINVETVWEASQPLLDKSADIVLVEGVGGFCVPLNDQETTIDLAKKFNFPVILVVGLRLGCLNHALLTYQAIRDADLTLAGWIANQIDPNMQMPSENIAILQTFLEAPCLGVIPFQEQFSVEKTMACFNLKSIRQHDHRSAMLNKILT